jgi:site-specific recombinase XerD
MNVQDLFFAKKSQYQDGILSYRRQKVSRIKKEADMKIKVHDAAKVILEKYSGDDEYLIDFSGHKRGIHVCRYIHATFQNAGIEKQGDYLSKIGHKAGEYVFYGNRHAMATIALNECGIDYMTVHQMLNHATPNAFKTTDVYIQKNFSPLWEANEKLLSMFDWSFYLNQ